MRGSFRDESDDDDREEVSGEYRIESPPSSRDLADSPFFESADGAESFELDIEPASQRQRRDAVRPKPDRDAAIGMPDSAYEPLEKHLPSTAQLALRSFAGYPDPPQSRWEWPAYALTVTARQIELRRGLRAARRFRPADVAIYEAALGAADATCARGGLAMLGALALAVLALGFVAAMLRG